MNGRDFLKYLGATGISLFGNFTFSGLVKSSEIYTQKIMDERRRNELKEIFEYNIEPLTRKIIEIESNWRCWVVGKSQDIGLMQITPIVLEEWNKNNVKKYSLDELFDPHKNIEVGEWYLYHRIARHYLPYYKLDITEENKAASYNAGPSLIGKIGDSVENFHKLPIKTQNYLRKLWRLSDSA